MNKKVVNNVVWIIGCRIIKVLLATFVSIFTARMLGPDDYGIINYASSMTNIISPFVLLGFNSILVHELINRYNNTDEGTILGTAIFSSLVCSLGGIILSTLMVYLIAPSDKVAIAVTAVYSTTLVFQSLELIQYWFQAKYRSNVVALVGVIAYVVISVYKTLLLYWDVSIYWFAFSHAFDYFIISAVLFYLYRKDNNPKLKFSKNTFKHLVDIGKYYMISSFMVTMFTQIDKLMIKSMLGNQANGLDAVAVTCSGMFIFVFSAIIEAMRPYVLEGKNTNEEVFEQRIGLLYSILIYLAIGFSFIVSIVSDVLIKVLYGSEYAVSSDILKVLIWYIPFTCIGGVKDIWILSEGKQKYLLPINTSGAIVNAVLNLLFISKYGLVGVAVATVVSQIFSNVLICAFICDLRRNISILWKSLNPTVLISGVKVLFVKVKEKCKR